MRGWSQRERLEAATAAFLIFFVCGCSPLPTTSRMRQPSSRVGEVQPVNMSGPAEPVEVPYIPAPTRMTLCGEPVPLNREAVYERFDKEFTLIVYNHAQVYLWLKRMPRYFPVIEERLRYYGLPDDLKYVVIAESDLLPNACSPKGAAGPWQFMPSTGATYGLAQSRRVDNRFSFQRSTESAFQLLKDLHDQFHSWALALAAYNAGAQRVLDAMQVQGAHDYYDLCLPLETERYIFRILAIKAVLSNPARYGYNLPAQYAYKPFQAEQVTLSLARPVPIRTVASAAETTFSEIKRLNPALRSDDIPAGVYRIKLPPGTREAFERNFKPGSPETMLTRQQAPSAYAPHAEHRAAVYRAEKRRQRVIRRRVEPVRAARAKHRIRLGQERRRIAHRDYRLARERRRMAVRKDRVADKVLRTARGRTRAPKAEAHRGRRRPRLARAYKLREKRKKRPARAISHKVRGKTGHGKSKLHGARKKGDKSLARR